MRLLHARPDLLGDRHGGRARARRAERVSPTISTDQHPTLSDEELRERMSGNLCRCGAHNGIVEAIHEVFADWRRADDRASAITGRRTPTRRCAWPAATPHAKFLGGGTNLVDLMRETIEKPEALVDVTGLSTRHRGRRATAAWSSALRPGTPRWPPIAAVRERYPDACPRHCSPALRRRSATWRRSAAI